MEASHYCGYICGYAPERCGYITHACRFGSRGYGMLLAEVGLPPGAEVDRAELAELLSRGKISRYELQPDRIVFYLWHSAEEIRFNFHFTPRYSVRAKTAPSTLSDYYNPDLSITLAPQSVYISGAAKP